MKKKQKTRKINVFEAFAGIGSQRKALSNITKKIYNDPNNHIFDVVGIAEWFVPSIMAYHAIHDNVEIIEGVSEKDMQAYLASKTLSMNSKNPVRKKYWNRFKGYRLKQTYSYIKFSEKYGNIFDISTLAEAAPKGIDLLTYSFPCQDLSTQGKNEGIKKGTRSGLLFEIERYVRSTKEKDLPEFLLMENVKALTFTKHNKNFEDWKKFLDSKGYKTIVKIYKSSNFGSAQSRERVFALSYRTKKLELGDPVIDVKKQKVIKDILDIRVQKKYILKNLAKYKKTAWTKNKGINKMRKYTLKDYTTFQSENYVYNKDHVGPTLTATGANSRIKVDHNNEIRVLNPRETYKYMGFTQKDYDKVMKLNWLNNHQIIFGAGNSISVKVLEYIFSCIL